MDYLYFVAKFTSQGISAFFSFTLKHSKRMDQWTDGKKRNQMVKHRLCIRNARNQVAELSSLLEITWTRIDICNSSYSLFLLYYRPSTV